MSSKDSRAQNLSSALLKIVFFIKICVDKSYPVTLKYKNRALGDGAMGKSIPV